MRTKTIYGTTFQIDPVVRTTYVTTDAEEAIVEDARVSVPPAERDRDPVRLLRYLIRHGHWSPFEMADMKFEVICPRDVSRQILRHRSANFQEFSQRYADPTNPDQDMLPFIGGCRLQHPTNRQAAVVCEDQNLSDWWDHSQAYIWNEAVFLYRMALKQGLAKEVARRVLPEGITPTRMRMKNNIRNWLFFCKTRMYEDTQWETRQIALGVQQALVDELPHVAEAFFGED